MLNPIITNNLSQIKTLCQKHFVKELYVFGSATTDNFKADSDVDFLVEFNEDAFANYATNYFDLHNQLKNIVKRNVDLVTVLMVKNKLFKNKLDKSKQAIFVS